MAFDKLGLQVIMGLNEKKVTMLLYKIKDYISSDGTNPAKH